MSRYEELRRLAEAARKAPCVYGKDGRADIVYYAAASPDVILALLDERERLRAQVEDVKARCIGFERTARALGIYDSNGPAELMAKGIQRILSVEPATATR